MANTPRARRAQARPQLQLVGGRDADLRPPRSTITTIAGWLGDLLEENRALDQACLAASDPAEKARLSAAMDHGCDIAEALVELASAVRPRDRSEALFLVAAAHAALEYADLLTDRKDRAPWIAQADRAVSAALAFLVAEGGDQLSPVLRHYAGSKVAPEAEGGR